jgi:hypothetical protein
MKRLSYTLAAFTLGAFLLVGCAKENNKYDKILTDGAWTLSTVESSKKTVIFDKNIGTPNRTQTSETVVSLSGGVKTITYTTNDAFVDSTNRSTLDEWTEDVSTTMSFTEAGVFSSEETSQTTHEKSAVNGSIIFDADVSGNPVTTSVTDIWAWANTANTKTQISFNGDTYNITVEKGKITLTISTSSETVQVVSATQTRTTTKTFTSTMVATR